MLTIKTIDNYFKKIIENHIRILLVTSAEIEKNKVNEVLKPLNGQTEILQYNIDNYEFYIGKFGNYDVIHVQTKIGSLGEGASTLTIDKALNIWKIQMVVMIGIAFGRGADCNQKIGDVLISKDIYMYEKYKIKEKKDGTINYKHLSNPYSNAGKILVKKFEDDCVWENSNSLRPKIHFGTIASGEKIIDSITEKNKLLKLGDTTYIIGGEMEATGLVAACSNNNIREWIVIKGISDWGDGNKVKNKEENQKMAINNTVSYCEYIFSKEKVFDEILEENPINMLGKMYKFPVMNTFSSIDILENYEVSLVPISSATQKLIQREQIINKLKSELDNGNHINIFGEIFSGKTTLIKLLASQYSDNIRYIDLRDKDIIQIEKTMFIILQIMLELESEKNLIIAIDNYPRINKNSKTEDLLERLLKEANTRNIKVIFTSLTSQENIIEDNIQNISYLNVDEIEKNDVIDLLKLYDAPSYMYQDKIVEFIEITGNRKLFVVKQIVKYLQKENWDIFKDGLIGIIDGKYVWKIKGTIQDALLDRVTQDNQKELLYRMGCVNYDLKIDEVKKISEIEPQISNPIEILREIEGSFVEYDNEKNMYRTNPLIAQISRENINSKTFININKVMAYNILDKKEISPFEIIKCIGFFNQAKEYNEAGKLYLQTINQMYEKDIKDEWGIKSIWKALDLPNMDSTLKLQIRVSQLRYYLKFGIDYNDTLNLTIKLIKKENYEDFLIAGVAILFINENPYKFNELLKMALLSENKNPEILKSIQKQLPEDKYPIDSLGVESLLWVTIPKEGEVELLKSWVDVLSVLEKDQYLKFRNILGGFFNFEEMYSFYIDKTWVNLKSNIPEDIEKIKNLIPINQQLVEFGKKVGDNFITAISIRNIVIFKCEYLKDYEGFDYGIAEVANVEDSKSKFIIMSMIGHQYYYWKRYEQAKIWLEKALDFDKFDGELSEKIWVLLELSEIYGKIDIEKSYEHAKETLKYIPMLDVDNKIRFYMEYLIRCFYLNKIEENILICLECTKLVLQNSEKRGLVAFFTHIIGYFTAYIIDNVKLDEVNKEYGKPYTRITIHSNNMDNDIHTDKKIKAIYMHILKLLAFYRKKQEMINFYLHIYNDLEKNGMGVTVLFPNEIRIFLIESSHIEKSIQLLKIMNIFKNNTREILPNSIGDNPLEFTEKIERIYLTNKKTTLEDISEVLIFNIIFLLIDKDVQVENILQMKEFQELSQQIRDEYIDIVRIIKEEKNITKEFIQFLMSKKEREKNRTFEIIYRLLLIRLLKGKILINYQINLLIYFCTTYGIYATEETLLKWCISILEKDIKENKNYLQIKEIKERIELYKIRPNLINAKMIYIEALKNLGFNDITEENVNWLKEL